MNEKKYIISEFYEFKADKKMILESEKSENGIITLVGILQKADALNRNGRIYPFDVLSREAKKYMELVEGHNAFGELDHPESQVVSLATTSHMVVDMWWEGKTLMGKVVLFDDIPAGQVLKGILKKGGVLGISSRGIGSVKNVGGKDIVQDDFELIAFDFVSSPSTIGAYMFKEGVERSRPGMIEIDSSRINSYKKEIQEANKSNIDKYKTIFNNLSDEFWKNL